MHGTDSVGPYRTFDTRVVALLCTHRRAAIRATQNEPPFLSLATDRGSIGAEGMQWAVAVTPSNVAFWPPCVLEQS